MEITREFLMLCATATVAPAIVSGLGVAVGVVPAGTR